MAISSAISVSTREISVSYVVSWFSVVLLSLCFVARFYFNICKVIKDYFVVIEVIILIDSNG